MAMKTRTLVFTALLVIGIPFATSGCGTTAKSIGERAFIEAVNLKCRSDKAKFAVAKRVAGDLADTPKGQELQADAQKRLDDLGARWNDLRATVAKLNGPKPIEDVIAKAAEAFKALPGEVADKTLTPAEAKDKLESVRNDLREKGFVECV
jgi:cell division protein FtsB